jgi:hypothetical protein
MIAEEGAGSVNRVVTVCRSPMVDRLIFSIVIRVCFTYGFRSISNKS